MNPSEIILEFNKIKQMLCTHALSECAKQKIQELHPYLDETLCKQKQDETTAGKKIIEACGTPPLSAMEKTERVLAMCQADAMLLPEQLNTIAQFIAACKRMKAYLKKAEQEDRTISCFGENIYDLNIIHTEITECIQADQVASKATAQLEGIRQKIETAQEKIQTALNQMLRTKKKWFSDNSIVMRNGRQVLPVKKEFKNQFSGTVIERSGSGETYFMEPSSVVKLREILSDLMIEEDNEIRKILYTLTALVDENMAAFQRNVEVMQKLDFIFAKAKFSLELEASPVNITTERILRIVHGRHPLLEKEICVPLDFSANQQQRGIIITGPNTGGKTVVLKTVGLLSMMAQCGLHVPAKSESTFCMYNQYLCDIGDGQSISENLSTFSAHMTNILEILSRATQESLVLLDELGSGTDPTEGMGIAIAVLEELKRRGCMLVVTTHYPEVKIYGEKTEEFTNARMEFDRESLRPTYKLELGKSGESCALYIARRLGLPEPLLNRAYQEAYPSKKRTEQRQQGKPKWPTPSVPMLKKKKQNKTEKNILFEIGDCVELPSGELGVVFQTANEKGEIGVQVKKQKSWINHKRIQLKVPASQLYPEDYDFSILFDTVENRKARHKMRKGYQAGLEIQYRDEKEMDYGRRMTKKTDGDIPSV